MLDAQPLLPTAGATKETNDKKTKPCHQKIFFPAIGTITVLFIVAIIVLYPITRQYKNSPIPVHSRLSSDKILAIKSDSGLSSKAQEDLITELPGLSTDINELGFSMFSGYLTIGKVEDTDIDKEMFYWFIEVEHEDDENAEDFPTLLWTNGGPGCSGLIGLLTEHGAFTTYSSDTIVQNDYSWNKYANMLYVEQPYGVGFTVPAEGKIVYGDSDAAADMDALIRSFLTHYTKFQSSDFYLSSESFGGHYMPRTTLQIMENNEEGYSPSINLKGFLVGNPLTDKFENRVGFMEALYGHGLMPKSIYDDWRSLCYDNLPDIGSASCDLLYVKTYLNAMDVDFYGLDFPTCDLTDKASSTISGEIANSNYASSASKYAFFNQIHARSIGEILETRTNDELEITEEQRQKIESNLAIGSDTVPYVECGSDYASAWLNTDSVQTALHAKSTGWNMCNYDVNEAWPSEDWFNGMETVYSTLVSNYDLKMLIYSGDDDSVCGIQGTQYWLNNMDNWKADSSNDWTEWTYNNQLAGFYTKYVTTSDSSLAIHFQSVRSAGHMVPETQPERALELLRRYLYDLESPSD